MARFSAFNRFASKAILHPVEQPETRRRFHSLRTQSRAEFEASDVILKPGQETKSGRSEDLEWLAEWLEKHGERYDALKERQEFYAQKQAHKENADFVYEGTGGVDLSESINPATGGSINWFLDLKGGDSFADWTKTGDGNDVIYLEGEGTVSSGGGDDVIVMTEGPSVVSSAKGNKPGKVPAPKMQKAHGGTGDDQIYGKGGTQLAWGYKGNDLIDLGDGSDIAIGGLGSDTFVIDLQNTGTDVILDFIDAGDKIEVLNGGEMAQDGDWFLGKTDFYFGPNPGNHGNKVYTDQDQEFYTIQGSEGGIAAIFGIGSNNQPWIYSLGQNKKADLIATMNSGGIEILVSQQSQTGSGSLEFV